MGQKALMLGAVGVLAEVSEVQRAAFNQSFKQAHLDWHWEKDAYREMLKHPGGKLRIARYAEARGEDVDVEAVYDAKVAAFEAALKEGVPLRAGIADLIAEAKQRDMKVAFVTGTDLRQVQIMLGAVKKELDAAVFDYIGNSTKVARGKPAPDLYEDALMELGVDKADAIAIEDTPESAQAAVNAGIRTFGFPGPESEGREFGDHVKVLSNLNNEILDG